MNLNRTLKTELKVLGIVSIPIRDLMNLIQRPQAIYQFAQVVSIPIRDLMNLNRRRRKKFETSKLRFNPY